LSEFSQNRKGRKFVGDHFSCECALVASYRQTLNSPPAPVKVQVAKLVRQHASFVLIGPRQECGEPFDLQGNAPITINALESAG
jgi:hypothetical protein